MEDENDGILGLYRLPQTVFTAKEVALIWKENNINPLKRRLNYYVKTGKLLSLRRGVYAKNLVYNTFELSNKLYSPSYVSFESVLAPEGIIFQHYDTVFAAGRISKQVNIKGRGYTYHRLKENLLLNPLGVLEKNDYFCATKERAFLDTLYIHKNYHFDNLDKIDWDLCYEFLAIYNNEALTKRVDRYYKEKEDVTN